MAVDNKVSIEIILDDGSVKRGFATIKKEAQDTGKDIEKNLDSGVSGGFAGLSRIGAAFTAIAAAAAAAGIAVKKALDLSLEGERINAIRTQFDNLAQTAGVSGSFLRQEFGRVGDGLIDIEDLLQRASVRITQLGDNSARLPEILEAARRVAFATGQDITQTFDTLAQGIATGNARALRQLGLIVDIDKATKDYAASLGLGVNQLTEQQRQAAALSATINQVNERFGNVDQSLTPLSNSLTRLRQSANDAFDNIARASNELFGPGFQAVAEAVTAALNRFNDTVKQNEGGVDAAAARIRVLNVEIEKLQALANAPLRNAGLVADLGGVSGITERIKQYREEITALNFAQQELAETQQRALAAQQAQVAIAQEAELAEQRRVQNIQNEAALIQQRIALIQAEIAAKQGQLALTAQAEQQALIEQQIREQQRVLIALQTEQQLDAVRKQFAAEAGFTAQQRAELELQIEANKNASLRNLEEQRIADFKAAQEQLRKEQQKTQAINAASSNAIVQVTQQSFATLGASLVQGQNAWASFRAGILGIIGDLLINVGTAIVTTSKAVEALSNTLTTLFGGFGLAGGLALIALGGALKAAGGGGLTGAATGASTSVLAEPIQTTNDQLLTQPTAEEDRERRADTQITVNFEGDVIGDSADTGARIVSLINQAFDRQGVVLRQGVV